jgi:hypothetical protein
MLNGMNPALTGEQVNPVDDSASSNGFDDLTEAFILLTNDVVEPRGVHSRILKLGKHSACFNRFVLADVSDEEHAIPRLQSLQKISHLLTG